MSWDDPPEPTEEEMEEYEAEQAVKNAPSVRIEGVTAEAVAIIIRETVRREFRLKETAEAAVKEAVEAAVREAIEGKLLGLTEEHLRPEVARIVAEGWSQTNSWGERVGGTKSLKDRIGEYLVGGRYDNSPMERIFKEELERAMKSAAGKAFTDALAGLRDKVDGELQARVGAALRGALGLK